jgi:hypothetical protein
MTARPEGARIMPGTLPIGARLLAAALAGALLGAGSLVIGAWRSPGIRISFDQPLPRVLSGFHGIERQGDLTFAWSRPRSTVSLRGLDRRVAWRCTFRIRGGRAPGVPQPAVALSADEVVRARTTATNIYEPLDADIPPADAPGLTLSLTSAPTFVPGPKDRRELGVQVDEIECRPATSAWPPRGALIAAAAAAAIFSVLFAVLGAPLWLAALATLALAAAQAAALTSGAAAFTPSLDRLVRLAAWAAAVPAITAAVLAWRLGRALPAPARFVLGYSAAILYVLLLALLHPSKALVDAVFHAHRLEWVHAGRYFFTQPMPDGVSFPYAIALYVVASPWMAFTRDHVALLRIVVCVVHVAAGAALYVPIARHWNDRLAGAIAVVLWSLVPQWFVVVGNANLTNAFGQSVATAALLAVAAVALRPRDLPQAALVFALAATAFLSHVSTFPLLAAALLATAAWYWWMGGPELRTPALWVAAVTLSAAIVSVVAYYGQFGEVYRTLDRVRGGPGVSARAPAPPGESSAPLRGGPTPSVPERAATAVGVGLGAVGWPVALLAVLGAWRGARARRVDRLTLTLLAWFATCGVFLLFGVLAPVEDRFYRYTVEFIGRVFYATWPAAIVLAGSGASWALSAGPTVRVAGVGLVAAAVWTGAASWWAWFR